MAQMLPPEKVAHWYFRLNGFLQLENFVIHPPGRDGARTDADLLGVRFPHRAEGGYDNPGGVMRDDKDGLALSSDLVDVVIAEVKTNQPCTLNGPWTQPDRQNIHRVLAAIGCLAADGIDEAATKLYKHGVHNSAQGLRIRLVAVGRERNPDLSASHPDATQVVWSELLGFMWDRLRAYRQQKSDVQQWDKHGRCMMELARTHGVKAQFIEEAKRLMGLGSADGQG